MKSFFALFFVFAVFILSGCDSSQKSEAREDVFSDKKVYFFYSNFCPHCHDALAYINKKYPNLQLTMVNVQNPDGYNLLLRAAKEYNLGNQIGTPLLLMGKNYLMGWADEYEPQFDAWVKPYLK